MGSVWGDIFRNKYLASVRNPPNAMTPDENQEYHPNINETLLKNSVLEKSMHAPEIKKKVSTEEELSSSIPMSVRGFKGSQPKESDGKVGIDKDSEFRFDIDEP